MMILSKEKAQNAVNDYVSELTAAKQKVRKNFNEMDLENVDVRDKIETEIINVEKVVDSVIQQLALISFE